MCGEWWGGVAGGTCEGETAVTRVLKYSFLYDTVENTENMAILVVLLELEQLFSMQHKHSSALAIQRLGRPRPDSLGMTHVDDDSFFCPRYVAVC